jgi:hypothetical protein
VGNEKDKADVGNANVQGVSSAPTRKMNMFENPEIDFHQPKTTSGAGAVLEVEGSHRFRSLSQGLNAGLPAQELADRIFPEEPDAAKRLAKSKEIMEKFNRTNAPVLESIRNSKEFDPIFQYYPGYVVARTEPSKNPNGEHFVVTQQSANDCGTTEEKMVLLPLGSLFGIACRSCEGHKVHTKVSKFEWKCNNCDDVTTIGK